MRGPKLTRCYRAKNKSDGVYAVSVGCTVDIAHGIGSHIIGQTVKIIDFHRGLPTILIIKPTRCTNFSNLFLEQKSKCFGQFLCPSSGV